MTKSDNVSPRVENPLKLGEQAVSTTDPRIIGLRLTVIFLVMAVLVGLLASCATVKVEPPSKPIEINLNVKIDGEIRLRLDEDIEDAIAENSDIF